MKHRSILFAALGAGLLLATAAAPAQAAWGRGPGGWHGGWHGGWAGGWHAGWRGPGWYGRPGWGPGWWGPRVYIGAPVVYPAPGIAIVP